MNVVPIERKKMILNALVEGNSIRSTERMTGTHRDTIMRLLVDVGGKCKEVMDQELRGFHSRLIQADEIWTFVGKKKGHLTYEEQFNSELGDQYVFVGLDADTKLVPSFVVGKRDGKTALQFMLDLQERLSSNGRIQLTTDAFRGYLEAVMNDQVKCAHRDKAKWTHPLQVYTSKSPFIFAL